MRRYAHHRRRGAKRQLGPHDRAGRHAHLVRRNADRQPEFLSVGVRLTAVGFANVRRQTLERCMHKMLMAALMTFGLLAGCKGEPAYEGVSFIAYNYTQFDMDSVSLTDKAGNSAVTMQVSVGAGEGSVACCYTLKGTEFTAKWRAADSEVLRNHLYDANPQQPGPGLSGTAYLPRRTRRAGA
ncbi:hypothetical protein G6F65_019967 [Rhizopus arrhizus]|nr:hypothetical protein G6F65_019967 [Rhizopus arrhizus]